MSRKNSLNSKKENPVWVVVEFRENNVKTNNTEVYYSAVPKSWLDFGEKTVLKWSGHFSNSSLRKNGIPPKEPVTKYPCKVISKEYFKFNEANEEEKRIFDEKKQKTELTTEADTDSDNSYNEDFQNINKLDQVDKSLKLKGDFNEEAEKLMEQHVEIPVNSTESVGNIVSPSLSSETHTSGMQEMSIGDDFVLPIEQDLKMDPSFDVNSVDEASSLRNINGISQSESVVELSNIPMMQVSCSCVCKNLEMDIKQNAAKMQRILQICTENNSLLKKLESQKLPELHMDTEIARNILESFDFILPLKSEEQLELFEELLNDNDNNLKEALVRYF